MQNDTTSEFLDLQKEYTKMTKAIYKDYSLYVIIGLSIIVLIEAIYALSYSRLLIGMSSFSMVFVMLFGLKWVWTSQNNYEIIITTFLLFFYFGGIYAASQDTMYLQNGNLMFFLSYSLALSERLMINVMADLKHRIYFSILAMIIRIGCMPTVEYFDYVKQAVPVLMSVFLDIAREKREKEFFYSYFNSREQVSKFKKLVVKDIPEAIGIISQDLSTSYFMNNSYQNLAQENAQHVQKHLSNFFVKEEIKEKGNNGPHLNNITLLDFLRNTLDRNSGLQKKHKCIVTFLNPMTIQNSTSLMDECFSKKLFEVKLFSMVWDDKPSIAMIFHDITEEHTVLSLKIADAQKDKILTTVSHELRTPLNGMLGMIQVMEKKIKDVELSRFLAICKSSTNLLMSLVSSILDLNQIRANTIKLNFESINIQSLLKDIVGLFEYQCKRKGIYLKMEIEPGTPSFLFSDKDRLSQILINLVGNAQKFTSRGGITIKVARGECEGSLKFSVQDTGIGISKVDQKRLFQVLGKINLDDARINNQGVGLGLTIAENLINMLNNSNKGRREIIVESDQRRGSTFFFTIIPAQMQIYNNNASEQGSTIIPNESESLQEKLSFYRSPSRKHYEVFKGEAPSLIKNQVKSNILLVDDDLFNIAVAEHLILSHGYKVITALSGQEALEKAINNNRSSNSTILILMDCQMPLMDGYETTRRLRKLMQQKELPEIPIVALTANDSEADKEACKNSGMCDHLSKPLKDAELARILKKYC